VLYRDEQIYEVSEADFASIFMYLLLSGNRQIKLNFSQTIRIYRPDRDRLMKLRRCETIPIEFLFLHCDFINNALRLDASVRGSDQCQ
jgi:hypothetical protein